MRGTGVDLQLLDHRVAQRTLREHALDGLLQRAAGVLGLHVLELGGVDAARVARMAVVHLVLGLVAGDAELVGVDDDDEIAGVHVRGVDGLVLATQSVCHFTGDTTEHLVGGVNHKPLVHHFGRLGAEGLHECFLDGGKVAAVRRLRHVRTTLGAAHVWQPLGSARAGIFLARRPGGARRTPPGARGAVTPPQNGKPTSIAQNRPADQLRRGGERFGARRRHDRGRQAAAVACTVWLPGKHPRPDQPPHTCPRLPPA